MKTKYILSAIIIAAISFSKTHAQDGGQIFRTNCGACHTVGKGKLVGPDLKGVQYRHSEDWILKWVKGSQAMVKAGDKEAVKVFNENSMIPMPDQALADNDIKTILAFIKTGGEPVAPVASSSAVKSSGTDNITVATQKVADEEKAGPSFILSIGFTNYLVFFLIGLLLIVIWVLSMAVKTLTEEAKLKAKN
ncbi:MAG TPA: cytochrome c [Bacteroidia bacterium]|jgi:cytochrome c2|nr:cytochrome c [Bacteroidia bacterium]